MHVCGELSVISISLRLSVSKTKRDTGLFPIGSLWESAQGESNGHVTMKL